MFVISVVLFLLPCSLLWKAWRGFTRTDSAQTSDWRVFFGKASLIAAVCSTALELVFFYSWFHNGGSPHGMMPDPGIWKFAGRISFGVLIGSVVLSAGAKGKWKFFIPAWAISYLFVAYVVFMLERD